MMFSQRRDVHGCTSAVGALMLPCMSRLCENHIFSGSSGLEALMLQYGCFGNFIFCIGDNRFTLKAA